MTEKPKNKGGLPSWDTMTKEEQEKKRAELRDSLNKAREQRKVNDAKYKMPAAKAKVSIDLRPYIGTDLKVNTPFVRRRVLAFLEPLLTRAAQNAVARKSEVINSKDWTSSERIGHKQENRERIIEEKKARETAKLEAKFAAAKEKLKAKLAAMEKEIEKPSKPKAVAVAK